MTFNPNIPNPGDLLSTSQSDLKNNFSASNTSFNVDHYAFSDLTANNGKHNTVTTPLIIGAAHPSTAAAEPKFYAMQDSSNLGVLQYSRGPSNAQPTPLTCLQSPTAKIVLANNAMTPIINITGLNDFMSTLYAIDTVVTGTTIYQGLFWNGTTLRATTNIGSTGLLSGITGNTVYIKNVSGGLLSNIIWTLHIVRIN